MVMTAPGELPVTSKSPVVAQKPADVLWQGTIHDTLLKMLLQKTKITVPARKTVPGTLSRD